MGADGVVIPAGKFNEEISCRKTSASVNAMGGVGGAYTEDFSVRGSVEEMAGGESEQGAGALAGTARARVTMRYNSSTKKIDTGWRLVFRGENWNVRTTARERPGKRDIDAAGASNRSYLVVLCERGVGA